MATSSKYSNSVIVKSSSIHGRGVFATRAFKKNEVVVYWKNTKEISRDEFDNLPIKEQKFTDIQNGKILLVGEPERFVNHCCDHNTISGNLCDVASRDINEGEEITSNYSNFFILDGSFECQCRSSNCRRIIKGRNAEE